MPGPSGYTTAFTRPDPLDPNDRQKQKTFGRAKDYPYDEPLSYGAPIGTDLQGGAYQRTPDVTPPVPRNKKPSDVIPYGQHGNAWEQLENALAPYEPGSQSDDAAFLGYGDRGSMGEGGSDTEELNIDALRQDFKDMFVQTLPQAQSRGSKGLFAILVQLDPEYSAELFAPEDDDLMSSIYQDWGQHCYAPGAEFDEEDQDSENINY